MSMSLFSKLANSEFYNDFETFSKMIKGNDITTNIILGSLKILAIKNCLTCRTRDLNVPRM